MIIAESTLPATSFGRPSADMVIVYDGECPFCSNFVALQKLRSEVGTVSLVDARQHLDDVRTAKQAGLDIDKGMLVFWNGQVYEGPDAVYLMARHGSETGLAPRLNKLVFSSPTISRALYPALRAGRNFVLRLLGRRQLND